MTAGISRVFARFQGILIFTSLQFFLSSTRHFLQQRETEMEQEILHVAATGNNKIPRNETNNETCKTCWEDEMIRETKRERESEKGGEKKK